MQPGACRQHPDERWKAQWNGSLVEAEARVRATIAGVGMLTCCLVFSLQTGRSAQRNPSKNSFWSGKSLCSAMKYNRVQLGDSLMVAVVVVSRHSPPELRAALRSHITTVGRGPLEKSEPSSMTSWRVGCSTHLRMSCLGQA